MADDAESRVALAPGQMLTLDFTRQKYVAGAVDGQRGWQVVTIQKLRKVELEVNRHGGMKLIFARLSAGDAKFGKTICSSGFSATPSVDCTTAW